MMTEAPEHIDISVIIPFLGREPDLVKCLESLARQAKREFEVIVVGDGASVDPSVLRAVDGVLPHGLRLVSTDRHVGTFRARKYGAELACGRYIQFVDHDDTLAAEYLSVLYQLAVQHGADVVECPFLVHNADGSTRIDKRPEAGFVAHGKEILSYLFSERSYNNIVNKLIRRSTWSAAMDIISGAQYEMLTFAEDLLCSALLASCSKTHVFSDLVYYDYLYNDQSTMNSKDLTKIRRSLRSLDTVMSSLERLFGDRIEEGTMSSFQRYQARWALSHLRKNAGGSFPDDIAGYAEVCMRAMWRKGHDHKRDNARRMHGSTAKNHEGRVGLSR